MAHSFGYLSQVPGSAAWRATRCHVRGWVPALLVALALAAPFARAQTGATGATGALARFTVFSSTPLKGLAYAPRAGAATQTVVFYPTARSPKYEYRGAMPLRFIEAATGTVVAEATIPPDIRDALLLFSPVQSPGGGAKTTLRYHVAVLDDGAQRAPAGGLSIINLSGLALSGTVGRENVTLRAGLNPPLAIGKSADVTLRTVFKERSFRSYAGMVALGRNQRALLILFPPFYKGSLEVQSRLLIDQPGGAAPVK